MFANLYPGSPRMVCTSEGPRYCTLVALVILLCGWAAPATAQTAGPQAATVSFRPSVSFARHFGLPAPTQEEPTPAEAPASERKLRIGIRGGVTLAKYYGDSVATYLASDYAFGPMGGVSFSLLLSDYVKSRFYFQPELFFQMRGVRREAFAPGTKSQRGTGSNGIIQTYTLDSSSAINYYDRIAYAQVPLLFRMDFGSENVRPYVSIGPYLGFAVSGKHKVVSEVSEQNLTFDSNNRVVTDANNQLVLDNETYEVEETTNLDSLSSVDFGGIINVGCAFPITSRLNLVAEVRYDVGFARVFDLYRIKNRNQSWCFTLGVEF